MTISYRRLAIAGAVVTASLVGLSACGSSGSDSTAGPTSAAAPAPTGPLATIVKAARAEGTVTWYTGLAPAQDKAAANAFTRAYGIKVNVLRETSGTLDQRYSSEAAAGSTAADVVLQSDPNFVATASTKGWISTLTPDLLPALADFPASEVHGASASVILVPYGIEYNTQALDGAPAPTKYTDLLNPKFNGKILVADPRASAGIAGNINYLYNKFGKQYLSALGKTHVTIVNSEVPGMQQLAAGEKAILVGATQGTDADLVKEGAPLKYVTPDSAAGSAKYLSISAKPPHPDAARLLANFLLTKAGGQPLAAGDGISPLGNLPGSVRRPSEFAEVDTTQAESRLQMLVRLLGI